VEGDRWVSECQLGMGKERAAFWGEGQQEEGWCTLPFHLLQDLLPRPPPPPPAARMQLGEGQIPGVNEGKGRFKPRKCSSTAFHSFKLGGLESAFNNPTSFNFSAGPAHPVPHPTPPSQSCHVAPGRCCRLPDCGLVRR
jgi:hypothetical protein